MGKKKIDPLEHIRQREKRLIGDPNVLTPHEVRTFFKACIDSQNAVGYLLIASLLTGRSVDYWLDPKVPLYADVSKPVNLELFF